eukprot:7150573-Prymnesium_polylepis.1
MMTLVDDDTWQEEVGELTKSELTGAGFKQGVAGRMVKAFEELTSGVDALDEVNEALKMHVRD